MIKLGFNEKIKGSHHIYSKKRVEEIINFQQSVAGKAKPYQVKQVRILLVEDKLTKEKYCDMKPSPKYEIIIYWSKDDNVYIAEVPELPAAWQMDSHIEK